MSPILDETPLSIPQAACRLPGSRGASQAQRCTVLRWITRGVVLFTRPGEKLKLEAIKVGRNWHTSVEALDRFIATMTADAMENATPVKIESSFQHNRAYRIANQKLIDMGC